MAADERVGDADHRRAARRAKAGHLLLNRLPPVPRFAGNYQGGTVAVVLTSSRS